MLRYRAALIDVAVEMERPIQVFSQSVSEVRSWAAMQLKRSSRDACVVVYRVEEIQIAVLKRDDQGTIQGVKPVTEKADQPG